MFRTGDLIGPFGGELEHVNVVRQLMSASRLSPCR